MMKLLNFIKFEKKFGQNNVLFFKKNNDFCSGFNYLNFFFNDIKYDKNCFILNKNFFFLKKNFYSNFLNLKINYTKKIILNIPFNISLFFIKKIFKIKTFFFKIIIQNILNFIKIFFCIKKKKKIKNKFFFPFPKIKIYKIYLKKKKYLFFYFNNKNIINKLKLEKNKIFNIFFLISIKNNVLFNKI